MEAFHGSFFDRSEGFRAGMFGEYRYLWGEETGGKAIGENGKTGC